ncbi:MAG: hypothetical protein AAF616_12820 [Bacteroidota bacterium]
MNLAVQITHKNELLEDLEKEIKRPAGPDLQEVNRILIANRSISEDRLEFESNIQNIYEGFYLRLAKCCPTLSKNDQKLAALIRLNLSSKQMSTILNISPKSIDQSKYRLKQKIGLEVSENLSDFINAV